MSQYRRLYVEGATVFLTLVTYQRFPIFAKSANVVVLRKAIAKVHQEKPFTIWAAVVLPDHIHFLWQLPADDANYSQRVSRLKVLVTRSLRGQESLPKKISTSRQKHRESNVWQRRFWEHTIKDEEDLHHHLDYIHYNPVKHQLVSCPHQWEYSSFQRWVERGQYSIDWACCCQGKQSQIPQFSSTFGE